VISLWFVLCVSCALVLIVPALSLSSLSSLFSLELSRWSDTTDLMWRQFSPDLVDLLIDIEPDFLVFPESRVRVVSGFLATSFGLLVFFVGAVLSFVFNGSNSGDTTCARNGPGSTGNLNNQSFIQRVRSPRRCVC
jgi:hypothetical protein